MQKTIFYLSGSFMGSFMGSFTGRLALLCTVFLFSFLTGTMAHGINFDTVQDPPVVTVRAYFSRTSPVAGALVEIYAPGDDNPYQTGRTDRAGNFAFLPDRTGEWTLRIDDERGHRDRRVIAVNSAFFGGEASDKADTDTDTDTDTGDQSGTVYHHDHEGVQKVEKLTDTIRSEDTGISFLYRVVLGLALIFGLTGVIYGVKARQALRNKEQNS